MPRRLLLSLLLTFVATLAVAGHPTTAQAVTTAQTRVGASDLAARADTGRQALSFGDRQPGKAAAYDETAVGDLFATDATTVTESGLNQVTEHLSQFGDNPPNAAMLSRLQSALDNGGAVDGADANFYNHELIESNLMANGADYEAAHAAALEQAGVSPFSLYHPDVIQQFPEYFNDNWRAFWELP